MLVQLPTALLCDNTSYYFQQLCVRLLTADIRHALCVINTVPCERKDNVNASVHYEDILKLAQNQTSSIYFLEILTQPLRLEVEL